VQNQIFEAPGFNPGIFKKKKHISTLHIMWKEVVQELALKQILL
jgi:hypothetical protein